MILARAFALLAIAAPLIAQTPTPAAAPGSIRGIVIDSLNARALRGAIIQLDPSGREVLTGPIGDFKLDSVPAGKYRLRLLHPMLDTLGLGIVTPELDVAAGGLLTIDVGIPAAERLVAVLCTAAQRLRGPAAIVGFVRDPDSETAVDSARVTLLYEVVRDQLGLMKDPFTREARPDANGRYKICGLPADMEGKLQVERKGVKTGEIPVKIEGTLALRGLALSLSNRVIAVRTDSGKVTSAMVGTAQATGRVVNRRGEPVEGARVTVTGSTAVAITNARGEFALDSLPSGSQAIEVRKVSYGVTELPVDLSATSPKSFTVTMNDYVPTLAPITSVSRREEDLEKIGFTRRKRSSGGYHFEGRQLNTQGVKLTDALRGLPSIRIDRAGPMGSQQVISDARDPQGCVSIFVDGTRWKSLTPGDLDDYIRPHELQAVEIYHASTVPAEFVDTGMSKCMTVVIWSRQKIRP